MLQHSGRATQRERTPDLSEVIWQTSLRVQVGGKYISASNITASGKKVIAWQNSGIAAGR